MCFLQHISYISGSKINININGEGNRWAVSTRFMHSLLHLWHHGSNTNINITSQAMSTCFIHNSNSTFDFLGLPRSHKWVRQISKWAAVSTYMDRGIWGERISTRMHLHWVMYTVCICTHAVMDWSRERESNRQQCQQATPTPASQTLAFFCLSFLY